MTRLTVDLIEDIGRSMEKRDADLIQKLGMNLRDLALTAICYDRGELDLNNIRVASVPVTSGEGVITTFSNSVCAVTRHLGMDGFVTVNSDVAGFAEAISDGADLVFMADDDQFIAYNVREGKYADNTRSTAIGYCAALEVALGGVAGKDVLVIGAGRVGSYAIKRLSSKGANVSIVDVDATAAESARKRFGARVESCPEDAIRNATAILNASPAIIPGEWIAEGAVIAAPGVPYGFDEFGERNARVIIHDPLQIGVAIMAVWSASYSSHSSPMSELPMASVEVLDRMR
jgi:pyrrolysine biosynthesis protein PylD